jgi:hypothetical protein
MPGLWDHPLGRHRPVRRGSSSPPTWPAASWSGHTGECLVPVSERPCAVGQRGHLPARRLHDSGCWYRPESWCAPSGVPPPHRPGTYPVPARTLVVGPAMRLRSVSGCFPMRALLPLRIPVFSRVPLIQCRSWWFGWAAFALISRGADRLVVQGDPGSCGWVQISWAEQRQNRAPRRREGMLRSWGQRRPASRTLPRQGRPPPAAPDKRAPPGRSPC